MPIQSIYIVPHGTLLFTPEEFPDCATKIQTICKSFDSISDEIFALQPDLIILTTPHGISLLESFGVYCGYEGFGTAEWQGKFTEYSITLQIDRAESLNFIDFAKKTNKEVKIEGIVSFIETIPIPLRWSEVVPAYFLNERWKKNAIYKTESSKPIPPLPKFMIISIPRSRLDLSGNLVKNSLELGELLADYFEKIDKKVVFFQSGDLAHTHEITSEKLKTLPQPYPIRENAYKFFDSVLEEWAQDPLKNENLLLELAKYLEVYLSCGYATFVVMQGIIKRLNQEKKKVFSKVLCNESPTYFGMMMSKHLFN